MVDWPIQIISQRYFSPLFASGADLTFKLYNRKNVADRINGSTVEFLKDGIVVSIRTISDAGNIIEIAPDAHS